MFLRKRIGVFLDYSGQRFIFVRIALSAFSKVVVAFKYRKTSRGTSNQNIDTMFEALPSQIHKEL